MKSLYLTFDNHEFNFLRKLKKKGNHGKRKSWHNFILELAGRKIK